MAMTGQDRKGCLLVAGGSLAIAAVGLAVLFVAAPRLLPSIEVKVPKGPSAQSPHVGREAPEFTLRMAGTTRKMSLRQLRGKPVVLAIWTGWSPLCRDQMPIIDAFYRKSAKENPGVKIVTVNSLEEESVVDNFIARNRLAVPVLRDTSGSVSERYEIGALPIIYFIDAGGTIRDSYVGTLSEKELTRRLERMRTYE